MTKDNIFILKVNKNKNNQRRVTIPKYLDSDYVQVRPIELNVFKAKRKYIK